MGGRAVTVWDADDEGVCQPVGRVDAIVRIALGLHLIGDVIGLWIAYNAGMYVEYAAARIAMVPLYLLVMLIYAKARPR